MRVLLIGPKFYGYTQAINKVLIKFDHSVSLYEYCLEESNRIKEIKNKCLLRIRKRFNPESLTKENFYGVIKRENEKIIKMYYEIKPDLVILIRGDILETETLKIMDKSKKVLWVMDSIKRLPTVVNQINFYDKVFLFEKNDVPYIKSKNKNISFLPLCADLDTYYPQEKEQIIDVLFIGALYPKRLKILKRLVQDFPELNIKIYGGLYGRLDVIKRLRYRFSDEAKSFMNHGTTPRESNDLYAQSKICLNIHHNQSQYGANMRFYETMAAKAFQLTDVNPYIKENFKKCTGMYTDYEDLKNKIVFYLDHPEERRYISENGYRRTIESESFSTRVAELIKE